MTNLLRICPAKAAPGVVVLRAEVPCCAGLTHAVQEAVRASGRNLPVREVVAGVRGDLREAPIPMYEA